MVLISIVWEGKRWENLIFNRMQTSVISVGSIVVLFANLYLGLSYGQTRTYNVIWLRGHKSTYQLFGCNLEEQEE